MNVLDKAERFLLFRITRLVTLLLILVLVVGIAVTAGIGYRRVTPDTHVSPDAVIATAQAQSNPSSQPSQKSDSGLQLSFTLQRYLSNPEKLAELQLHIRSLSEKDQREYVNNLDEVVSEAEKRSADPDQAISRYYEVKDRRLSEQPSAIERALVPLYVGGTIFGFVLLIAVLSLVLVLLAIERNTRRTEKVGTEPTRIAAGVAQ